MGMVMCCCTDVMFQVCGRQDWCESCKYFLSEEYQTTSAWNLPLLRQALEQKLEEASQITYFQVNGENVPVTKVWRSSSGSGLSRGTVIVFA